MKWSIKISQPDRVILAGRQFIPTSDEPKLEEVNIFMRKPISAPCDN